MTTSLRILHLEDTPKDAELIRSILEVEGLECEVVHVKNKEDFEAAVSSQLFDVVLSDFALPHYNGLSALDYVRRTIPSVPFILVSGTVGEEIAVQSLRTGATDYILKQKPARLVEAIRRALEEAHERSKRHEAEKALRKSEERFQFAVRATNDVIWDWDLLTNKFWRNENFYKIFGYRSEDIEPGVESWLTRIHSEDRDRVVAGLDALGENGGAVWSDEYRFRRGDGNYAFIFDRGYVVYDAVGKPARMIGAMMDVTEKKKLEAQFLRAQRMESIGALAGGIAHDLNNVLQPIMMVAEALHKIPMGDDHREMVEIVQTSAARGADMVKQILSFARGVAGEHKPLPLKPLITDIDKLLQRAFPRSIKIQVKLDGDLPLVKGDATQLHQVIMNLCVNARDAMPKGGSLVIEVKSVVLENKDTPMLPKLVSGPHVVLRIADTGQGIPPELLEKIYEPFFTTKGIGKGTGLGLSTVMGIVKTHHGFIEVTSQLNQGTAFLVYLPASNPSETDLPHENSNVSSNGYRGDIFLKEDE